MFKKKRFHFYGWWENQESFHFVWPMFINLMMCFDWGQWRIEWWRMCRNVRLSHLTSFAFCLCDILHFPFLYYVCLLNMLHIIIIKIYEYHKHKLTLWGLKRINRGGFYNFFLKEALEIEAKPFNIAFIYLHFSNPTTSRVTFWERK